jgi:hypothetical protein
MVDVVLGFSSVWGLLIVESCSSTACVPLLQWVMWWFFFVWHQSEPNSGNGGDYETYSWTQTLAEVTLAIPVPVGTKARFVACDIKSKHIKAGLKGQPPIVEVTCLPWFNPFYKHRLLNLWSHKSGNSAGKYMRASICRDAMNKSNMIAELHMLGFQRDRSLWGYFSSWTRGSFNHLSLCGWCCRVSYLMQWRLMTASGV